MFMPSNYPKVPNHEGNDQPRGGGASVTEVRSYLRGVESLAKEASASTDIRVLTLALRVLACQNLTIARIEGRV